MPRAFTLDEKQLLEISVQRWLKECQRWAENFDTIISENANTLPDDTDSLVIAATYFIMAAGCVYLHCESLLESNLGAKDAKKWLKNNFPLSLQVLKDRRDWINHGAIYRSPDFELVFHMFKGPDKTIQKAFDELQYNKEVMIREVVRLSWTDGYGKPTDDIMQWHQDVIADLERLSQDIKRLP